MVALILVMFLTAADVAACYTIYEPTMGPYGLTAYRMVASLILTRVGIVLLTGVFLIQFLESLMRAMVN